MKPKKKLTNIRPREVSLVDAGANLEDFYVTKRKEGNIMGNKTEQKVLKKMEVAIHSINFFKSQYPTKEDCLKKLMSEGIQGAEGFEVKENDYEFRFVVNPAEMFEGTSLAMYNYMPLNQGVDSLVAVKKNIDDISKAGKKMSSTRLKKLTEINSQLAELLKELSDEPKEDTEKPTEGEPITKSDAGPTKESDMDKEVKKVDEPKVEEPKSTAPVAEPTVEVPATEQKIEASPEVKKDEEVLKRLETIEKKQVEEISSLKKENEELKKRLEAVEKSPAESKGSDNDKTLEVSKKQSSFWKGVL